MKKIKPDGSKTIYVGGIYEVDKTSGGTVTRTVTYYPAAGAMRINIVGGSNTLYYILKDHLGSASVITDASDATITNGEQRYYPYGGLRLAPGITTTFVYDPNGNMVKKIKPDASKTCYVGRLYEVDKTSGGSVTPSVPLRGDISPKYEWKS